MKYGFVYIWRDRKYKRFYIGAHWGTEDDGYICSSHWMKQAYKRRPNDFKRRILVKIFTNRQDMFNEEARWQAFIKDEELKIRYYNIRHHGDKHWSGDLNKALLISEKISKTMKNKHNDPEYRKIFNEGRIKSATKNRGLVRSDAFVKHITEVHRNRSSDTKLKISENNRRLHEEKRIGMYNKKHSAETRLKQSEAAKRRPMLECPYCHKMIQTPTNFYRWHGDNCTHK